MMKDVRRVQQKSCVYSETEERRMNDSASGFNAVDFKQIWLKTYLFISLKFYGKFILTSKIGFSIKMKWLGVKAHANLKFAKGSVVR